MKIRAGAVVGLTGLIVALAGILPGCSGAPEASQRPFAWEGDMDAIFQSDCTQCHGWASSYDGVAAQIESGSLESKVANGHHISGGDRDDVLSWIDDGYPY